MFIKSCILFFCSFSESSARPTEICSIIFTKRSAIPPSQQSNISLVWVPKRRLRERTLRLLFSLQSLGRSTNQIRSRTRATTDRAHVTRVRLNTCQSHWNTDRNDPSVFLLFCFTSYSKELELTATSLQIFLTVLIQETLPTRPFISLKSNSTCLLAPSFFKNPENRLKG